MGLPHSKDNANARIVWWDGLPPPDELLLHRPWQLVNKIPNMDVLCYKSVLFQSLNQMQTLFPAHYGFFPRTLMLPHQFNELYKDHIRLSGRHHNLTWILKPENGCCGAGIRLIKDPFDIVDETTPAVIQQYIPPLLLGGFKFDFRFYILIANMRPLSVFIFRDGIARFCTKRYRPPKRENLRERFRYITNTAINVENGASQNPDFTRATSCGISTAPTCGRGSRTCRRWRFSGWRRRSSAA